MPESGKLTCEQVEDIRNRADGSWLDMLPTAIAVLVDHDIPKLCSTLLAAWNERDAALAQVEQMNENLGVLAGLANDKRKDNEVLRAQLAEAKRVIGTMPCVGTGCPACEWLAQNAKESKCVGLAN